MAQRSPCGVSLQPSVPPSPPMTSFLLSAFKRAPFPSSSRSFWIAPSEWTSNTGAGIWAPLHHPHLQTGRYHPSDYAPILPVLPVPRTRTALFWVPRISPWACHGKLWDGGSVESLATAGEGPWFKSSPV